MILLSSFLFACLPQKYADDTGFNDYSDTDYDNQDQDTSNSNNGTGGNDSDSNTVDCQEGDSDCNGIVGIFRV